MVISRKPVRQFSNYEKWIKNFKIYRRTEMQNIKLNWHDEVKKFCSEKTHSTNYSMILQNSGEKIVSIR